jgi:hypothetical protein
VSSGYNFLGGGYRTCIHGAGSESAVVVGGSNSVSGGYSFIGGGATNCVSAGCSAILGGRINCVSHNCSFVIGAGLCSSATGTTYVNNISKPSGQFRISHPDPAKTNTKYLQHSFVESPTRGENIYRYEVTTCNCTAVLELPSYYKYLNENDQIFVTPKNHFGAAYGEINESQTCLTFTSNCDGAYNVLLIGTRKDIDAKNGWTGIEVWK